MREYIGVKRVKARPMTRIEYNEYRRWEMPSDENGDDAGFIVECLDGGKPNHPDHARYISWSPEDVFKPAYRNVSGMNFGLAVEAMKAGDKVARAGWNGKNVFVFLVPGSTFTVNRPPLLGIYDAGTEIQYNAHIDMVAADGAVGPWLASQSDVLADDWSIVA